MKTVFTKYGHVYTLLGCCLLHAACTAAISEPENERGAAREADGQLRTLTSPDVLALGEFISCVLLVDTGDVRCWGHGYLGALGYGNTNSVGNSSLPYTAGDVSVGGTVTQVAAGERHTCALLDTGDVRCWGYGDYGQLGYGNTNEIGDNELPSTAGSISLDSDAVHIAAGSNHTCALLDTNQVQCWGYNVYGQLGYGNTTYIGDNELPSTTTPVTVGSGTLVQLAAGFYHTCALNSAGNVYCWGYGGLGALGGSNTNNIGDNETLSGISAVSVGGTVTQIAAGHLHTCALLDTGDVRCWGYGAYGQLGYGNTNSIGDNESPSSAGDVSVGGTVTQITARYHQTCALLDTGNVRCWGYDSYHELGYPGGGSTVGDNELPSSVGDVDVGDPVIQVASGRTHTCVVLDTYGVRCWGSGQDGALGYGNNLIIGDNEHPSSVGDVQYR